MKNTNNIEVNGITFGENRPLVLIAGPCVIEDEKACCQLAEKIKEIATFVLNTNGGSGVVRELTEDIFGYKTRFMEYVN